MSSLHVGDDAIIDFEIKVKGKLCDPSALALVVTNPSGIAANYVYPSTDLTRTSPGRYQATIDCTAAGTWRWRLVSVGPVAKGARRGTFNVEA